MPQRSNGFQRLIRIIEEQVAPAGATVEESAMIPDNHDGTLREVDVLIRVPAGEREIKIGIECRDHKRRADLPWIEQIKSKYDLLPIDRRVAVARRGFSEAALRRARLWNIETLSLQAAERVDWPNKVTSTQNATLFELRYQMEDEALLVFAGQKGPPIKATKLAAHALIKSEGDEIDLLRFASDLYHRVVTLPGRLQDFAKHGGTVRVEFGIRHHPSVRFPDGRVRSGLEKMSVFVVNELRSGKLTMSPGLYNTTAFSTGAGFIGDSAVELIATERKGEDLKMKLLVQTGGETHEVTLDLIEESHA